jgi:PhoH-like ATPase
MEVLNEIDGLLKSKKREIAMMALDNIIANKEHITFTGDVNKLFKTDDIILDNVNDNSEKHNTNDILITNDKMLQLKSYIRRVECQPFLVTNPFKTESEHYTGFIDVWGNDEDQDYINNCFFFKNGKLHTYTDNKVKCIRREHEA